MPGHVCACRALLCAALSLCDCTGMFLWPERLCVMPLALMKRYWFTQAEGLFWGFTLLFEVIFSSIKSFPVPQRHRGSSHPVLWLGSLPDTRLLPAPRARYVLSWRLHAKHHHHHTVMQSSICNSELELSQEECLYSSLPCGQLQLGDLASGYFK